VVARSGVRTEADVVASLDLGRTHTALDLGMVVDYDGNKTEVEAVPGLGVSVAVIGELRIGAVLFGEFRVNLKETVNWLSLGPVLSWTHGRFWLSAGFLIGLFNIDTAPRLNWAVAF
jgi:hypothetical protein